MTFPTAKVGGAASSILKVGHPCPIQDGTEIAPQEFSTVGSFPPEKAFTIFSLTSEGIWDKASPDSDPTYHNGAFHQAPDPQVRSSGFGCRSLHLGFLP